MTVTSYGPVTRFERIALVAGLVLAHDRAVALLRSPRLATATQYPLLLLMVLYTVCGLWLLSRG